MNLKELTKIIYEAKEKKPAEFWAVINTVLDSARTQTLKEIREVVEEWKKEDLEEKDWEEFDSEHSWIVGFNQALSDLLAFIDKQLTK